MTKEDGGPAFPCDRICGEETTISSAGMTLRDYFAAKAMQELYRLFYSDNDSDDSKVALKALSREAYQWADAMLEAREQK